MVVIIVLFLIRFDEWCTRVVFECDSDAIVMVDMGSDDSHERCSLWTLRGNAKRHRPNAGLCLKRTTVSD